MNVAAIGRTVLLILALFIVLAGINMLGRMSVPIAARANPKAGSALQFVFG